VLPEPAEHLTEKQRARLSDLLQYGLKTVRTHLSKESVQALWEYTSHHWADRFVSRWLKRALRSRLEPIETVARRLRAH
jgi:transposase